VLDPRTPIVANSLRNVILMSLACLTVLQITRVTPKSGVVGAAVVRIHGDDVDGAHSVVHPKNVHWLSVPEIYINSCRVFLY